MLQISMQHGKARSIVLSRFGAMYVLQKAYSEFQHVVGNVLIIEDNLKVVNFVLC
jgi:hypothetical protein